MRKIKLAVFHLFIWFISIGFANGQDPYYWKLTDENGLPSQTVYQVLQDQKGLIWIATANGLCSFDGKFIENYDCSALNDQEILKIQEGPNGVIWGLNLSGQLFNNNKGKINVIDTLGKTVISRLADFYISRGRIYFGDFSKIGSNSNLFCFDAKSDSTIKLDASIQGRLFSISQVKSQLLVNSRGVNSSYIYFLDPDNNNRTILVDSIRFAQTKHICFYNNRILVPIQKSTIRVIDIERRNSCKDWKISSETKNILSVGDFLFLFLNRGVTKTNFTEQTTFFQTKRINSVYLDREGNYFYATNEGVFIEPTSSQNLSRSSSKLLTSNKTRCIIRLANGEIVFSDDDGNVFKNGVRLNKRGVQYNPVNSIAEIKSSGTLLIGADNGLYFQNADIPIVKTPVKCIYLSKENIYFGASQTFGKLQGEKYQTIEQIRTYAICETKDGLIWVGTDKGIYTYDGIKLTPFFDETKKEQIPFRVTDMKLDRSGRLWVTTLGHGVVVIVDKKIENIFNKSNLLSTNTVYCVTFDRNYVWLGTYKGVVRCDYGSKKFLNVSKYSGLPSDEIFALCADKDNLLIGTSKGLVSMPYEVMEPSSVAPNIHLKNLLINETVQNLNQKEFKLQSNQNNLFIEYISYQYRSRGDARYEYRISELDTNWTITDQRFLKFTNLSPGKYHLDIRAINECDVRSKDAIQLCFDIDKPMWLQWWFLLGCLVAAGFGSWILTYWRFRVKHKQQVQQLEYKARIEDLKNLALQAQMNPHFIFNSLNAVQHYLLLNESNNAVGFLSKFASLIRMVFEFSKKKEISLSSELEMIDFYLELEKLRFGKNLELVYEVSEELMNKRETILLPPLLIQPIIENSFRHGLFHKKDKGKLIVKFELVHEHHVKCTIEDNGVGRNKAETMPSWKPAQYSSSGLNTTEERLSYWHQKYNTGITDYFLVEDLFDGNKPCGTRVTLIL